MRDPVLLQRNYYRTTADQYDRMHVSSADSHAFALAVLVSMIDFFGIQSILDVGERGKPGRRRELRIAHLTIEWSAGGWITGRDKSRIQRCASPSERGAGARRAS